MDSPFTRVFTLSLVIVYAWDYLDGISSDTFGWLVAGFQGV